MTTITSEVQINAPVEKVWRIMADFGGIYKYNPNVSSSHSTSAANSGVGATRHCDLLPAGSVEERISEWNEGRDYKVDIFQGKGVPPFKTAVARLSIRPQNNGSRVQMRFDYHIKFGLIGRLLDWLMVKKQFGKAVPSILAGLKHYAETGEEVDRTVQLNLQPVTAVA